MARLVHDVPLVLCAARMADDAFLKMHQDMPPKVAKCGLLPVSPVEAHEVPFVEVWISAEEDEPAFENQRLPSEANFDEELMVRGNDPAAHVVEPFARALSEDPPVAGELTARALPLGSWAMKVMFGATPMVSFGLRRTSKGLWPE